MIILPGEPTELILTKVLAEKGYEVITFHGNVMKSDALKLAGLIYPGQPPYRLPEGETSPLKPRKNGKTKALKYWK